MDAPRKYQPIWDSLKKQGHQGSVSISAQPKFHARIVKAVQKEKGLDLGYKISIEPQIAFLTHSKSFSVLTFHLRLQTKPDGRFHKLDPQNI